MGPDQRETELCSVPPLSKILSIRIIHPGINIRNRSKTVDSKTLVLTALHVLVAWNDGCEPDPTEIQILKKALPSVAHLPVDELCCRVIHDFSGRTLQETSPVRLKVDEVA